MEVSLEPAPGQAACALRSESWYTKQGVATEGRGLKEESPSTQLGEDGFREAEGMEAWRRLGLGGAEGRRHWSEPR